MTIAPISAVGGAGAPPPLELAGGPTQSAGGSFADMLIDGVQRVDQSIRSADATALAFVTDDTIPVHQVTVALEEARLSFELMLQIRSRLVEAYQELTRMQL